MNILGIQIFYETTWKWIMYFELKVICELFIFYPCTVTCDYLNRYYSLCDIGILAPFLWWLLAPALCRRWVSALYRRLSCGLGLDFLVWNGVVIAHSIISSFMLRYFEEYIVCNLMRTFWEVLCCVNLFILVILFWGNDFVETIWKFLN